MQDNSDNTTPKPGRREGRARTPWRRDAVILERLAKVERRHLAGQLNTQIAGALGVDEKTVRDDLKRIQELWLEATKADLTTLRAQVVAELNDTRYRAIAAAEWDEYCERAVLFDDPELPDADIERLGLDPGRRVTRDQKGAATFRGQKAASLNVARQATMDKAKVLGLVVDKQEVGGGANLPPIRFVEVVPPDGGDAAPEPQD